MLKKLAVILTLCGIAFGGELEQVTEFVKELVEKEKMNSYEYLEAHCSKKVLDILEKNYDYECYKAPCYAMWIFRVGANGAENWKIIDVKADGDGWYTYTIQEEKVVQKKSLQVKIENGQITITDFKK